MYSENKTEFPRKVGVLMRYGLIFFLFGVCFSASATELPNWWQNLEGSDQQYAVGCTFVTGDFDQDRNMALRKAKTKLVGELVQALTSDQQVIKASIIDQGLAAMEVIKPLNFGLVKLNEETQFCVSIVPSPADINSINSALTSYL